MAFLKRTCKNVSKHARIDYRSVLLHMVLLLWRAISEFCNLLYNKCYNIMSFLLPDLWNLGMEVGDVYAHICYCDWLNIVSIRMVWNLNTTHSYCLQHLYCRTKNKICIENMPNSCIVAVVLIAFHLCNTHSFFNIHVH